MPEELEVDLWSEPDGFNLRTPVVVPPDYEQLPVDVSPPEPQVETVAEEPVAPPEPEPEPESEEPKIAEYRTADGSICRVSKVSKGPGRKYQAEVKPVEGNSQYFYSDTKDGLLAELVKAQANATAAIHRMSQAAKPAPPKPKKKGRDLTTEERAKYNEIHMSDPVAALEFREEITSGMSKAERDAANVEEDLAAQHAEAQEYLAKYKTATSAFLAARPFYADPEDQNRWQMINWMSQKFLGSAIDSTQESLNVTEDILLKNGYITSANLCKAFDVLTSNGLLEKAPTETTAPPPPVNRIDSQPRPVTNSTKPVPAKPKVTGLPVRSGSSIPDAPPVPTPADLEAQFDAMPEDEKARAVYGKDGFLRRMLEE